MAQTFKVEFVSGPNDGLQAFLGMFDDSSDPAGDIVVTRMASSGQRYLYRIRNEQSSKNLFTADYVGVFEDR